MRKVGHEHAATTTPDRERDKRSPVGTHYHHIAEHGRRSRPGATTRLVLVSTPTRSAEPTYRTSHDRHGDHRRGVAAALMISFTLPTGPTFIPAARLAVEGLLEAMFASAPEIPGVDVEDHMAQNRPGCLPGPPLRR